MASPNHPRRTSRPGAERNQQRGSAKSDQAPRQHPKKPTRITDENREPAAYSGKGKKIDSISSQAFGAALFGAAIGVAVTDSQGHFLLVNDALCEITGYSEEELLSMDWLSISHPHGQVEMNAISSAIEPFRVPGFSTEKKCIRKNGSEIWLRSSLSPLRATKTSSLFVALVEDITDRKRAERALAAKQSELREAERLAFLGSWQWNPKTDAVTWSDELYRLAGRNPSLPAPTFIEHASLFTPDSWDRLKRGVENTLRTGAPYELELQVTRQDGNPGWVISRGEAVRNHRGRIIRLRGTIQDITQRKRAEQALAKSEEKFVKAFNAVPAALTVVTAAGGRQIEVNDALLKMTGYKRGEVIGRTYRELGYWQNTDDRQKLVNKLLAGEHLRNVECGFRKKGGELFTGLLSADLIELHGEHCIVAAVMDITDLRRTQEALRSSEKRAALFLQQTMFGIIEWDDDFRVVEWNTAAESIFGYSRAEAIGRHANELILPPDVEAHATDIFKALLRRTGGQRSVNDNVRKDGERIVCEWFNTPLITGDGDVIGIVSMCHDITAQTKAQSELMASQAILSALFESTDDMIWIVDPERFGLKMFNSGVARYFEQHRKIPLRVGMTPDDLLPTPELRQLWKTYYRSALEKGSFKQEYETVVGNQILDLSFYPLVRGGRTFGISVFGKNVTVSRRTARALEQSESRYRSVVESSNDWVWEVDADSRYTYVGPQCQSILGYQPEEILGRTPFDLMPQAEAHRVAETFRAFAAKRKSFRALENTNLHKAGHEVILETNGTPVFHGNGNFAGYRGMDRDITERKRAEIALRESEEKYRTMADNLPGVAFQFYATDHDWGFNFVHENAREVLAIEAEPLDTLAERLAACLEPEDVRAGLACIRQAIARESTLEFETKFVKPTGEEIYIRCLSKPRRQGDQLVFHGILVDITPRKRAERALRESEERLRLATQAARMYAFEWDRTTDAIIRSGECVEILGLTPGALNATGKEVLARMQPVDRNKYLHAISTLAPEESCARVTYRMPRSDGTTVWLEDNVRAFFDQNGSLLRTIGMTADITARKEAQRMLDEVSGRLITAQEEERSRIARELHDGLSQALAVIAIELTQAASAAAHADVSSKLEGLCSKLQSVVSEIGHLSHELHPSTLTHLGLSAAIRVLCQGVEQAHSIEINFADKVSQQNASQKIALCLYRVAQEALQNVVKHSRCKQAWVELEGSADEISLHVWDRGVGFNTKSLQSGLGLISMRERLRLVGGRIAVTSRRNSGTRIDAYIPLREQERELAA